MEGRNVKFGNPRESMKQFYLCSIKMHDIIRKKIMTLYLVLC